MISMEEDEGNKVLLKYICKLCKKRFPCGRSLGGHMRSHLTKNSNKRKRCERRRRRRRRSSFSSCCVDVSEEEAVAMCLIMLSRDVSGQNKVKCFEAESNTRARSGFECTTCNEAFHSHQPLGGSRKNTKTHQTQVEEAKIITKTSTSKGHECPFCLKVFPSGQALGGHKRSHFIITQKPVVPKIRDLLDLNLPLPTHEEEEEEEEDFVANSPIPCW